MTSINPRFKKYFSSTPLWTYNYPKHTSFICCGCGQCCGDTEDKVRHILLLKTDAERIWNETSFDIHEFAEKIHGCKPYIYQMRKTEDGKCFFFKNNLCTIYKIRPLICRFYPFQLKNLGNNSYSFSYTNNCPGIGKGSPIKRAFFESLFQKFVKAMEENSRSPHLLL
ncbi:MAG: YkgJ family cysteine cluster protein [Thermoproteota archaeon]